VLPPEIKGNPEAIFEVTQLPSGEVISVKLKKSSGHAALDAAVERAILKSSPLPKPEQSDVFSRLLTIPYRPLEGLDRYNRGHEIQCLARCRRTGGGTAHAQLTVEITGAGANRLPVAIAEFTGERIVAQALTSVVRADLERSGLFRLIDAGAPAGRQRHPPFEDLKTRGADAVAGGSVATGSDGRYETRVRLSDVPKQASLGNPAYLHTGAQLRATGHRIADFVYEKLTGEPGVLLHPHRLRGQEHRPASSCRSPTPTAATPQAALPRASRSSRRPGRPTAAPGLCVLRAEEADRLRA
jgi:TonB family protein